MRTRRSASACVVTGLLGLAAAYAFFVRTARGQLLDDRLHLDGSGFTAGRLLAFYNDHVLVGEIVVLVAIVAISVARSQLRRGLLCIALPIVTVVLADLGKAVLPRTPLFTGPYATNPNTFPSGHVGFAAATVAAVLLVLPLALRPVVAAVGAPAVVLVLVATVQAHWHRASDGIGSIFLVLALSGVVVLLSPARPPAADPVGERRRALAHA